MLQKLLFKAKWEIWKWTNSHPFHHITLVREVELEISMNFII